MNWAEIQIIFNWNLRNIKSHLIYFKLSSRSFNIKTFRRQIKNKYITSQSIRIYNPHCYVWQNKTFSKRVTTVTTFWSEPCGRTKLYTPWHSGLIFHRTHRLWEKWPFFSPLWDLSLKSFPCLSLSVFDDNRSCHSIVHIGIRVAKRNRHRVGEA